VAMPVTAVSVPKAIPAAFQARVVFTDLCRAFAGMFKGPDAIASGLFHLKTRRGCKRRIARASVIKC
jgi:hypothetical protein